MREGSPTSTRERELQDRQRSFARLARLRRETAQLEARLGITAKAGSPTALALGDDPSGLVARHAPDVVSVQDAHGRFLSVSSSVKAFGWSPEELTGKVVHELIHEDDLPATTAVEARLSPHQVARASYRLRCQDGSYRWVETTNQAVDDEHGVRHVVSITRDVHNRRLAERHARAVEHAFFREQHLALVGRLADAVGHEIANPLTAALLSLSSVRTDAEWLKDTVASLDRARAVLDELRVLAQVGDVGDIGATDAAELAERALGLACSKPDVSVDAQLAPVSLVVDRARFFQAVHDAALLHISARQEPITLRVRGDLRENCYELSFAGGAPPRDPIVRADLLSAVRGALVEPMLLEGLVSYTCEQLGGSFVVQAQDPLRTLLRLPLEPPSVAQPHFSARAERRLVLEQAETWLRALDDESPQWSYSFVIDPAGQAHEWWVSSGYCRVTGLSQVALDEHYGWFQIVHPDDRQWFQQRARELPRAPERVDSYRIATESGRTRWVRDYARVSPDERREGWWYVVGAVRDITETRARMRQLQEQSSLLEHVSDAIISTDNELVVRSWNPAASQMYGYAAEEVVHKARINELLVTEFTRGDRDQALLDLDELGSWHGEVLQRTKSGVFIQVLSSVSWVTDQAGARVGMVAVNRDVTAIRDAQARAHELEVRLAETEQRAEVADSAAMLAHEIGNPLNSMKLQLEVLRRGLAQVGGVPLVETRLGALGSEIVRLQGLLLRFRDLARPLVVDRQRADLVELVRHVATLLQDECDSLGIAVELELPENCPILVDCDRLQQVVLNLGKNAMEAMPEGGVLGFRLSETDEGWQLCVDDTGVGIPEGMDPFEPFVTSKHDGLGLGLALVRRVVVAHGGDIRHRQRDQGGTRFEMVLPKD